MSADTQWATRERAVIEQVAAPLKHVPDAETEAFDARLAGAIYASTTIRLFGVVRVAEDIPVEIKTCQFRIADRGSNSGRRRGRWKIAKDPHEHLVGRDGVYLLAVCDGATVLAWAILPAEDLTARLSWTSAEKRGAEARVPWSTVFAPDEVAAAYAGGDRAS